MRRLLTVSLLLILAVPAFAERFVVLFRKGPAWDESKTAGEQQHFAAHSANLRALRTAGQLLLGARYADVGMIVIEAAGESAARAAIEQDPTIGAKVFAYELHPAAFFYEPSGAPSASSPAPPAQTGIAPAPSSRPCPPDSGPAATDN